MTEKDYEISVPKEDTVKFSAEAKEKAIIEKAFEKYDPKNRSYSTYLPEDAFSKDITINEIDKLAENAQNNLQSILQINRIVRKYSTSDDLIGLVVEAITNNLNTEIRLKYGEFKGEEDLNKLEKAKSIIKQFNKTCRIDKFIADAIPLTYMEGNYISYLRKTQNGWTTTYFPLGVGIITDYNVNGDPVVMVDMVELKRRLSKMRIKTNRNKYLFYKNVEEEIKETYPTEVYKAFQDKDRYAKLDIKNSGVIRTNNIGRRYGVTSIFKAIKPTLMLNTFAKSDDINAKAKAKKIIHQVMNKEIMGQDYKLQRLSEMAYAHENFLASFVGGQNVVITTPPTVKEINYVEPKTESVPSEKIYLYRNSVLTSLGIGFLSTEKSTTSGVANISISQLLKCINRISEQIEDVLEKWYTVVLSEEGFDSRFVPDVEIIDSEQMDYDLKIQLANILYNTVGASRETVFDVLGLSVEDEAMKRKSEKEKNYDKVFESYGTAYTKSNNNINTNNLNNEDSPGRPTDNDDIDRQEVDKEYNEEDRQ